MMDRETLLELIPAYALDALDDEERQAVEAFIARDPLAQKELAEYEMVTAVLPLAVPLRPAPAHLQNDLRARLASRNAAPAKPAPTAEKAKAPLKFPTWALAAAVLVIAVIGGLLFVLNQTTPIELTEGEILFNQLLEEGNFQRFDVSPNESFEVEGELLVAADGSQSVLRIASLPNRSTEESYQLWLITDEESHSGGLFYWPNGHGPYYVIINAPVTELVRIGMSIEPESGSPLGNQPTGPLLFGVQVAQAR